MVEPEPLTRADQEARLAAELQTARTQAQAAAKLVLDLNSRLEAARKREQQFQLTLATLQSALQGANEALAHERAAVQAHQAAQLDAKASIQRLTLQLLTARTDIRRLSKLLDGQRSSAVAASRESDTLAERTRQMQAEQEALQQQLATLSAALRASQQENLEAEARQDSQSQELAELRRESQSVRQQFQALEQQTLDGKRNWGAAQQAWDQEKAAQRAALDAARCQLVEAEDAKEAAFQSARSESGQRSVELENLKQQLVERDRLIAELQSHAQHLAKGPRDSIVDKPARPDAKAAVDMPTDAAGPLRPVETVEQAPSPVVPTLKAVRPALDSDLSQAGVTDPCPQLGLITDRETRHAFASVKNRCYALVAPLEVTFTQQGSFCLYSAHTQCPILTGEIRSPRVPIDTKADAAQRAKRIRSRLMGWQDKR